MIVSLEDCKHRRWDTKIHFAYTDILIMRVGAITIHISVPHLLNVIVLTVLKVSIIPQALHTLTT